MTVAKQLPKDDWFFMVLKLFENLFTPCQLQQFSELLKVVDGRNEVLVKNSLGDCQKSLIFIEYEMLLVGPSGGWIAETAI